RLPGRRPKKPPEPGDPGGAGDCGNAGVEDWAEILHKLFSDGQVLPQWVGDMTVAQWNAVASGSGERTFENPPPEFVESLVARKKERDAGIVRALRSGWRP